MPQKKAYLPVANDEEIGMRNPLSASLEDDGKTDVVKVICRLATFYAMSVTLLFVASVLLMCRCGLDPTDRLQNWTTRQDFASSCTPISSQDTITFEHVNRSRDPVSCAAVVRNLFASYPDLEMQSSSESGFNPAITNTAVPGLGENRLGLDGKPVFKGGVSMSSKEHFDQWYHDDPVANRVVPVNLTFTPSATGTYVLDSDRFFPVHGKGWADQMLDHKYFFTLEFHHAFIYRGGEQFTFRGHDNLWVFISGSLALNLDGVSTTSQEDIVKLDSLGLTRGQPVSLDVFFAGSHTNDPHFHIETTIGLDKALPPVTNGGGVCSIVRWPLQQLLWLLLLLPLLLVLPLMLAAAIMVKVSSGSVNVEPTSKTAFGDSSEDDGPEEVSYSLSEMTEIALGDSSKDDRPEEVFYSLSELQDPKLWKCNPDIVERPHEREQFLAPDIFEVVFGMAKGDFTKLPVWRQSDLKKQHQLF